MTSSAAPQPQPADSLDELRQRTAENLPRDSAWGRLEAMRALRESAGMALPEDADLQRLLLSLFQVESLVVQLRDLPTPIASRDALVRSLEQALSPTLTSQP